MVSLLSTQVAARNKLNGIIKDFAPGIAAAAQELTGCKILKADNSLRVDAWAVIDGHVVLPNGHNVQVFHSRASSSLDFMFKTSVISPDNVSCEYSEETISFASVSPTGVVNGLRPFDPSEYPTDYTVDSVIALREQYAAAKKLCDQAEALCHPFGVR